MSDAGGANSNTVQIDAVGGEYAGSRDVLLLQQQHRGLLSLLGYVHPVLFLLNYSRRLGPAAERTHVTETN